jgi:iron(III) transport system substrate-binding protein
VNRRILGFGLALALFAAGCGGENGADTVVVYTSVSQGTVDAVVAGFEQSNPGVSVDVFRAPTGELTARIAAEQREGGVRADVLWLTDPLSMQAYDAEGALRSWDPEGADVIDPAFRSDTFWGTRILNLVIVANPGLGPAPASWDDLTGVTGGVALPDPGFAGSAFAALAYFALTDGYGMDFLRDLRTAGAVQVGTPGDVVTGVAEGQYAAGITLDFSARSAVDKGSPIEAIWPEPGAIALYSPIAVWDESAPAAAEDFVQYVLTEEAQAAIAATGWQPILASVPWEEGGRQVTLDWTIAFDRQQDLLDEYRSIFGG